MDLQICRILLITGDQTKVDCICAALIDRPASLLTKSMSFVLVHAQTLASGSHQLQVAEYNVVLLDLDPSGDSKNDQTHDLNDPDSHTPNNALRSHLNPLGANDGQEDEDSQDLGAPVDGKVNQGVKTILNIQRLCDLPIIVVTSLEDSTAARLCLEAGVDGYLLMQELSSRLLSYSIWLALYKKAKSFHTREIKANGHHPLDS